MTTKSENIASIEASINSNPSGDITPKDFRDAILAIADLDHLSLPSATRTGINDVLLDVAPDNNQNLFSVADQRIAFHKLLDDVHAWVQSQSGTSSPTTQKAAVDAYLSTDGDDMQTMFLSINADLADNWYLPGNVPPVAVDDSYTTPESTQLVVAAPGLLTNDTDPDGDPLTVNTTPIGGPLFGIAVLAADGSFTYTPNPGHTGGDAFTYEISDGQGGTSQATASIEITPTEVLVPFFRFRGDESDITKAQWDAYIGTLTADESGYYTPGEGGVYTRNVQNGLDLDESGTCIGHLGTNQGFPVSPMNANGEIEVEDIRRAVTLTNATNRINETAHGLTTGAKIRFVLTGAGGGSLPTEIEALRVDGNVWAEVVNETTDDFQIRPLGGGSVVTFTTDGSGVEILTAPQVNADNHWLLYCQGSDNDTDTTTRDLVFEDISHSEETFTDRRYITKDVMLEAQQVIRATGANPADWDSSGVLVWEQYHGGQITYNWIGQSTATMAVYVLNYGGTPVLTIQHQGCTDPRATANRSYTTGGGYTEVHDVVDGVDEDDNDTVKAFTFQTEQDYRLRIRRRADWTEVQSYFAVYIQPGSWSAGVWTSSGPELRVWQSTRTNQIDGSNAGTNPVATKPAVQVCSWGRYLSGDTGGMITKQYIDYLVTNP